MTLTIKMVSPEVQALQRELRNHPELWLRIRDQSKTFEDVIALVAEHLAIVMHGVYLEPEINKLCQIMVQKLQDQRKVIIADPSKVIDLMQDAKPLEHF